MKVWAKTLINHKIQSDVVQEFTSARPSDLEGWTRVISSLCQRLELERPVILNKHIKELNQFGKTIFRSVDYIDFFQYDAFEIEVFPEPKNETEDRYCFF